MRSYFVIIILLLICNFSFSQKKAQLLYPPMILPDGEPEYVSTCEISKHKKQLVYTRFNYSGFEEYWGLYSPDKGCKIDAHLDIPNYEALSASDQKLLSDLNDMYRKKYAIIDLIGWYEDGDPNGYGHLGSNSSKFKVKKIILIQLVDKKLRKK